MKFIRDIKWSEVFRGWKKSEADNSNWVECATKIKGWPDWESWRKFTASQIEADKRKWQLHEFTNPLEEIPQMLVGPYGGWQTKVRKKNRTTFCELLSDRAQRDYFLKQNAVASILRDLPFETELIGLVRKDLGKIVCIEGHHRAVAITLAKKIGKKIDFKKTQISIALAVLEKDECYLMDEILKRGTSNKKIIGK